MNSWIFFLIYGLFFIGLESTWPLAGDFLLLAVIYLGFFSETLKGFMLTVMLGFLLDVASIAPFGTSLVSYLGVFAFLRVLKSKIFFHSHLSRFFWTMGLTFLCDGIAFGWIHLVSDMDRPISFLFSYSLSKGIINGLLGLLWFYGTQTRIFAGINPKA